MSLEHYPDSEMQAGSHRLGNAVVDHVLTCPVVDGGELEHRPGYSTGQEYNEDRELSEDDKYKWDYCSPAQVEAVVSEDEELGEMEAVPLPAHRENGGSGYNPGHRHSRQRRRLCLLCIYLDD